ncbi:heparinase II/III family protein [Humitalea sp. 24SJ18S-53]|uniref:heparinase II/III family protein n=1 Tax=Humitalea sp. 24SJ18S-53 TaxID=3422307 RepID=UPI003D66B1C1
MSNRRASAQVFVPKDASKPQRDGALRRAMLRADAAWRLGFWPIGHFAWHRLAGGRLADAATPAGPFLASAAAAGPAPARDWHGPFDPAAPAHSIDLFAAGDVRPVWERNRLGELASLAQCDLAAAESLLAGWVAANPPFRGPNWACGQEAALRVLHLGLALGLLDQDPSPGMRDLVTLHSRRIAQNPAYAMAQDNNHPISEAAGLFACGLLLRDGAMTVLGSRRLSRAVGRLVAPCGNFAPVSPHYQRLLLDVLWAAEWLRQRHGAPAFAAPFRDRAAAATRWLARLACPDTGALPRIGHCDGSAFADLANTGPDDARASILRATAIFGATAPDADWIAEGLRGWSSAGARAVLRTGPIRFRPAHADLLHLDLWDGPVPILRDGGTGAYNPAPADRWWLDHLPGTAAHNTIAFDGQDQMPRAGRFLFARWPRTKTLPDGAAITDHAGRRHERRIAATGRAWRVEDRISGPFADAVLRWRLGPGAWAATPDGAEAPHARLRLSADAPCTVAIEQGWASPAYGVVEPAAVVTLRARAPVHRLVTEILLPDGTPSDGTPG